MKKKKILILSLIILFILIVLLIILNKVTDKEKILAEEIENNPIIDINENIEKVGKDAEFFIVEECICKYFKALNESDGNKIYNMTCKEYTKKYNLNTSNIVESNGYLADGFENFLTRSMYSKNANNGSIYQYYVLGEIIEKDYQNKRLIYIIVNLDKIKNTFSIIPAEEQITKKEYELEIKGLQQNKANKYIDFSETFELSKNEDNTFVETIVQGYNYLNYYMKNYTIMALYFPEEAFELLNEEYKEKRFNNDINEYKDYNKRNEFILSNFTIEKCTENDYDDYKEYVIIDTNENYYIFRVTDIAKYSIILDYYTIDIEQIINKYDESNAQDKVLINAQKVISAINSKDYKYIYEKLYDQFKNNNYQTFEEFKNYMEDNFIGNLGSEITEFSNEGETYICNINFYGKSVSNTTNLNMQIVMKLLDDRDFVMSFNIK